MADTYIKIWDTYESYFEPLSAAEVGRSALRRYACRSSLPSVRRGLYIVVQLS